MIESVTFLASEATSHEGSWFNWEMGIVITNILLILAGIHDTNVLTKTMVRIVTLLAPKRKTRQCETHAEESHERHTD